MYRTRSFAAFLVLVGASCAGPVGAQVERSGGGANALVMQQYQQAVSERSQLQAQNAKLNKELDDLKKQLGAAQQQATASKAGVGRSQAAVEAARAANERTQQSLDETKGKMQELVGRFRETITTLRAVETERAQLQQQLAANQSQYDKCAETNYSLYQVNSEVLERYAHQGAFSYFERSEPFTRLKRTQIENLVIEYRQRVEELRVKKSAASKAAVPAATSGPATIPAATPVPPSPDKREASAAKEAAATPPNH